MLFWQLDLEKPQPLDIRRNAMRTILDSRFAIVAVMTAAIGSLAVEQKSCGAEFYVAPGGKDGNPGTREQPLRTLEAARDAARKAEAGPHRIVVMPGEFFLAKTFELDARDNGLTIEADEVGKSILYGGAVVSGWRRDGDRFWCADLLGVEEGTWDFRALVVDGRLAERARLPESGTFLHKSEFNVRWLSSVGGGWERKPTEQELTTMRYDPQDIPATLEVKNAEIRVYHMWDESMVGVARNDTEQHTLVFSTPGKSPPGAFGVKKYVVFNTSEGMTQPGQWYLDRVAGRLVYWPLPGEDMANVKVIAPRLERIISLEGSSEKPLQNITIRGLVLQATTTPLKAGGFSAGAFDGALRMDWARQCAVEKMEICCVGGQGIVSSQLTDCRIADCHVHHIGACGIRTGGKETFVQRNHIHHVGTYYPSAVALSAYSSAGENEKGLHLYRNEIHDGPYSGIIGGGRNLLIEENLIYRVMCEMHDGAAIYGGMRNSILRGNMVRDVVAVGQGYGASAYYLDEGAEDCFVERNVSVGVPRPSHNHIARNITIRDNVFIVDTDMQFATSRSAGLIFERNTLFVPGEIKFTAPNAIQAWKDNVVFRNGLTKDGTVQPFTIDDAMPPVAEPKRMSWSATAVRVAQPPKLDGEIGADEWPGGLLRLDREPSRWSASGAPVFAELAYDDQCLYVAINAVAFDVRKLRDGTTWGQDDGAEVAIAGKAADGQPTTFVLRGYPSGKVESVSDAGASTDAARRPGEATRFVAKTYGKTRGGWRNEWAIPFESIGLKPETGLKFPFNLTVYRSEDGVWRCWEGTLAETWRLDEAGTLHFK
jgi:hypothetical protein